MHNPRVVGVERAPDLERELTLVRPVRARDFATASPSRARVRPELELTRRPRVAQRLETCLHHENEEQRGHVVTLLNPCRVRHLDFLPANLKGHQQPLVHALDDAE